LEARQDISPRAESTTPRDIARSVSIDLGLTSIAEELWSVRKKDKPTTQRNEQATRLNSGTSVQKISKKAIWKLAKQRKAEQG
jgi:hypothetical protein